MATRMRYLVGGTLSDDLCLELSLPLRAPNLGIGFTRAASAYMGLYM